MRLILQFQKNSIVAVLNGDMIGRNHVDSAALLGVNPPHRNSQNLLIWPFRQIKMEIHYCLILHGIIPIILNSGISGAIIFLMHVQEFLHYFYFFVAS